MGVFAFLGILSRKTIIIKNAKDSSVMTTIARSERFLWSFIGLVGGSVACVQTQRTLWRSTSELSDAFLSPPSPLTSSEITSNPSKKEEEEGFVFGKLAKAKARHFWNESVDFTFKPIVDYLSKKGY
tara:strand:- start:405 stop:785 length:381 start_codon:yes stop_codon:yes gene_type:complete